ASDRPGSVGGVVLRNLLRGGFAGPVMPVNPKHQALAGVLAYPDVKSLPKPADLAVICTPARAVPGLIAALGAAGTRAAVVLSAGLAQLHDGAGVSLEQRLLEAAKPHGLRVLGPNCLGLGVPGIGLNATFANIDALPGDLAFVSQSGAVCTVALDWACGSQIGFSHFVSLGDSADVDAADLLDWLGADANTRAILLYLESTGRARKFLSAARAAARNKPVIAIKAGRVAEGAHAATSHTGALAGADDVCDAALRRAGIVRVDRIDELFDAAETLARSRPLRGDRVAILTNGGGLGVLAADRVAASGGRLAALADATLAALDAALPASWSHGNPIDIVGDAPAARYAAALRALLDDPGIDVVFVVHAPTALANGADAARVVGAVLAEHAHEARVLTSWPGRVSAEPARRILRDAGVATYDTPEDAIAAFARMLAHRRNQELLMEVPPSQPIDFTPDIAAARQPIDAALAAGRSLLSEPEAKAVLAAFGVPVVETEIARDADEAVAIACRLGLPVALKILSPDVTHKSDVGGVTLDLETPEGVADAARAMRARLFAHRPDARPGGFTVQRMARRPGARELIVGAACDPAFGPFVLFGHGGTAAQVIGDRAVALPPLNASLARELVSRTRVAKLLDGYRNHPPADLDAVCNTLVQVAQILVDLPEVVELDLNPLLADEHGVLALDARIRIEAVAAGRGARAAIERLAIRPYPRELEETVALRDGSRVLMRPIRPEDEPAHQAMFASLAPEDVRFRFFNMVRELPHSQMARYTQIDYDRELAFVAVAVGPSATNETLGVVRGIFDPDNVRAEFAILVRSDQKGRGLGYALLDKLVRHCRARGAREVVGQVLPDNRAMLELAHELGFKSRFLPGEGVVEVRLRLDAVGN
ncbi:MAG: bifunctional acetate--CoA ligase family protein/GNAT family N-acetyltransferase, partial [Proteobacteria bacterium]|nr:bifunctional acetate--CoA ligase family protein/GNAT family N-acetyltransferase [Pseudomonadota bacterium]